MSETVIRQVCHSNPRCYSNNDHDNFRWQKEFGHSRGSYYWFWWLTDHSCPYIRPFARFGIFPVGGRSTAIRLHDGGVWVLASTPLEAETKTKLDELGPVKYGPPRILHYVTTCVLMSFGQVYSLRWLCSPFISWYVDWWIILEVLGIPARFICRGI